MNSCMATNSQLVADRKLSYEKIIKTIDGADKVIGNFGQGFS
jgi:hypothetical protein